VDYNELKKQLAAVIEKRQADRRIHVRVRMRVILKLKGTDAEGKSFELKTNTENVSAGGFLCACSATLLKGTPVEVFLMGDHERFVGKARVVRRDSPRTPWQHYAFQFTEMTSDWILQPN
jgi:hypothetical protein